MFRFRARADDHLGPLTTCTYTYTMIARLLNRFRLVHVYMYTCTFTRDLTLTTSKYACSAHVARMHVARMRVSGDHFSILTQPNKHVIHKKMTSPYDEYVRTSCAHTIRTRAQYHQ